MGDLDIYEVDLMNYKVPGTAGSEGSTNLYSGPPLGIIRGKLLDKSDVEPLEGQDHYQRCSGNKVGETESNEAGEYFITIEAGKTYTVHADVNDYTEMSETVELPAKENGGTSVAVKVFLMNQNLTSEN